MSQSLTQTSFDQLLALLDADREQAGLKYESLRQRLIKFFDWRDCENAEELTDIVFDRILRKITEGEQIQKINAYSATIAQFVFKEHLRQAERQNQSIEDNTAVQNLTHNGVPADENEDDSARHFCFEKCLAKFSADERKLLLNYHDTDERTMIQTRRRIADSIGVSMNSLRIRICRLKTKLENCTLECCDKNSQNGER